MTPCLISCANFLPKSEKSSYTYQDFEQRAPASLRPQVRDGDIDEFHLKTQADYHFTMAEAYALEGQAEKAIESYKLVLVYDPTAIEVRVKLASEYLKKGFISEAIQESEIALKANPNLMAARFLLAGVYTTLKMYPKARENYELIVKNNPKSEEAWLYIGAIYVEEKKFNNAVATFKTAAALPDAKGAYLAHYYTGKVYQMQGKISEAQTSYEKALSVNPKFVDGVIALGGIYEDKSKTMAKKLYRSYVEKYGEDERIAETLANLYIEDEQYDEAVKQLQVVEGGDNGLGAKVKIAMIFIEQKKYDQAISRLKAILQEVPESDKIKFYLAAVYEEINEGENAIEIYKQIPLASNYYTDSVLHGVYLLKTKERYEEALAWNKEALQKRPDVIQFYTMYASLLDDKKQYKDALVFLKKSEKNFPEDEQIQFFLGSFFDKLGDRREAIARMQKVLSINTDHSQAMNFIAYTYAEMGENLDEAMRMAKRATELKPDDAFYLDTLGWVHFKSGKTDKSIQYLEAAYKLAPGESIIAQHLGDAYYRYQLLLKAKLFYKKAIETEQDNEEKRKIQQKLASTESALSNASAKNIPTTSESRKPASDD